MAQTTQTESANSFSSAIKGLLAGLRGGLIGKSIGSENASANAQDKLFADLLEATKQKYLSGPDINPSEQTSQQRSYNTDAGNEISDNRNEIAAQKHNELRELLGRIKEDRRKLKEEKKDEMSSIKESSKEAAPKAEKKDETSTEDTQKTAETKTDDNDNLATKPTNEEQTTEDAASSQPSDEDGGEDLCALSDDLKQAIEADLVDAENALLLMLQQMVAAQTPATAAPTISTESKTVEDGADFFTLPEMTDVADGKTGAATHETKHAQKTQEQQTFSLDINAQTTFDISTSTNAEAAPTAKTTANNSGEAATAVTAAVDETIVSTTATTNAETTVSPRQEFMDVVDSFKSFSKPADSNANDTQQIVTNNQPTQVAATNTKGGPALDLGARNDNGGSNHAQTASHNNNSNQSPTAVEGTGKAGSYNFASQLSATKAARGGQSGLLNVVEQVSLYLNKQAKAGVDSFTMQLRPADLGRVDVRLEISADKQVQGKIIVDNQAALDLLSKDSSSLTRALQDAGLQADSNSLQFSLRGDGQGKQAENNSSDNNSFEIPDEDLPFEEISASTETYYITPGRVNLKV